MSASGHQATWRLVLAHVGLPGSDQKAEIAACRLSANSGHGGYSITSSARPSNDGGMVKLSALADLRLMISSTLVT